MQVSESSAVNCGHWRIPAARHRWIASAWYVNPCAFG